MVGNGEPADSDSSGRGTTGAGHDSEASSSPNGTDTTSSLRDADTTSSPRDTDTTSSPRDTDTFTGALRYPTRGEHARDGITFATAMALTVALAGGFAVELYPGVAALAFGGIALVGIVGWLGYLGRVLAATVDADLVNAPGQLVADADGGLDAGVMPALGGIRALLATGARVALASLPYVGAPFAILYVTVLGISGLSPGAIEGGGGYVLLAGGIVSFLLALGFIYAYPAAVGELAASGSVRRALSPWTFTDVLAHAAYLYAWMAGFSLVVLSIAVYGRVFAPSGIFGIVSAFAAGYASAVAARLAGMGYRRARRR